jgi:hypothetical protein
VKLDPFLEEHSDKLKPIEQAVLMYFRSHRHLVDHNVDKIYEAIQRHYEKLLQGKNPPSLRLNADEEALHKEILPLALSLFAAEDDKENQELLIKAMKILRRSIHTWTGSAYGRQGYLNYIDRMLP